MVIKAKNHIDNDSVNPATARFFELLKSEAPCFAEFQHLIAPNQHIAAEADSHIIMIQKKDDG